MSPTQRTLKHLRRDGYQAGVVERWNVHARVRQDLFGIIDVVAIRIDQPGVLGVQCTSESNAAARVTKILASASARVWLRASNRLEVWGWKKLSGRWIVHRRNIRQEDFA